MNTIQPGTTAATPPATPRATLPVVLTAVAVTVLALRALVPTVLLWTAQGQWDAPSVSAITSLAVVGTLVPALLAVTALIITALIITVPLRREVGAVIWLAAAVLIYCLPVEMVAEFGGDPIQWLVLGRGVLAGGAAVVGLVLATRAPRGEHTGGAASGRSLSNRTVSMLCSGAAALIMSLWSAAIVVPVGGGAPWMVIPVWGTLLILGVVALIAALRARRDERAGLTVAGGEQRAASAAHAPDEPVLDGAPAVVNPYSVPDARATVSQAAQAAQAGTVATAQEERPEEGRLLLGLRLIAPPAAIGLILVNLFLSELPPVLVAVGCAVALTALVGAVVGVTLRSDARRWLDGTAEILIPLAILLVPVAVVIASINDSSGWGPVIGVVLGGIAAVLLGCLGLIFTLITVRLGRYAHRSGSVSAVATASVFAVVILLVPAMSLDLGWTLLGLVLALVAVGLVAGVMAVSRQR